MQTELKQTQPSYACRTLNVAGGKYVEVSGPDFHYSIRMDDNEKNASETIVRKLLEMGLEMDKLRRRIKGIESACRALNLQDTV